MEGKRRRRRRRDSRIPSLHISDPQHKKNPTRTDDERMSYSKKEKLAVLVVVVMR